MEKYIDGYEQPVTLPKTEDLQKKWQSSNRTWWENNPMRYDWNETIGFPEFSKEFYIEIDKRFFSSAMRYMPYKAIPFDALIHFDELAYKDVLEIGVGNGSHAQLLAQHAKSFTGIDITEYAVNSTMKRMGCFGLAPKIVRMDAEKMDFADNTFDFIWSWGVIHHSANTENILKEMHRVLRPGGTAITMVYHRSIWYYYVLGAFFRGVVQGDLLKTRSLHKTVQKFTDGAIARMYTPQEWRALVSKSFVVKNIEIYGLKEELIPLPAGRVKNVITQVLPDSLSRFFTNQLKFGSFLVSTLEKR